jgi:hypothetical protein
MVELARKASPEHMRQRAQEARMNADQYADSAIRDALLEIAALYEQVADLVEKRAPSKEG